jgi:precorrin-6A/cobalt-precorrin-6A reductase
MRRLLILGGTGEAAALAQQAQARFGDSLDVVTALAGRTAHPARVAGEMRVGGFGGAEGLATYLRDERVDLVIDATHPFAVVISENARIAAEVAGVPRLALVRATWRPAPTDNWIDVPGMAEAAAAIAGRGRRVFLTVGERSLAHFAALAETWFLVRLLDAPRRPIPLARNTLVLGRGPFETAQEGRLLDDHRIDLLVTRASGGPATEGKIMAARERSLPVVLVRRPPPPRGARADSIEAALAWLYSWISGSTSASAGA